MGYDYEKAHKEIAHTVHRTFKEDLKIILRFFGFKIKEKIK